MANLIELALAPALVVLFYIFIRDKYEKEPLNLLFIGVLYGVIITFPIIKCENLISLFTPVGGMKEEAFFSAFAVAALVEEAFKYVVLFFLVWRNNNFNERFDGIVYAVFISLGFAGYENIMYVLNPELGGVSTAIARAFISVPAHGLFGVTMGYYFAISRFEPEKRMSNLVKAFVYAYIIHGVYDFILLSGMSYMYVLFIPFLLYMWRAGFLKMKKHIQKSPFKVI